MINAKFLAQFIAGHRRAEFANFPHIIWRQFCLIGPNTSIVGSMENAVGVVLATCGPSKVFRIDAAQVPLAAAMRGLMLGSGWRTMAKFADQPRSDFGSLTHFQARVALARLGEWPDDALRCISAKRRFDQE